MNLRSIRKLFARSPDTHRSVLFWHWPTALPPKTVEREIDNILANGIGGVLIDSPPSSHAADYLNDDWLTALAAATSRARKRHDSVWIFDDLASPNSPAKDLRRRRQPEHTSSYLQYETVTAGDDIIEYFRLDPPYAVFVTEESGQRQIDRDEWMTLAGTEETLLCFHHRRSGIHTRYLHAESVRDYLDQTYAPMRNKTKRFFGNTLGVILANNAELHSGSDILPWDEDLPEIFERAFGYPLLPELPNLVSHRSEAPTTCYHFWSLIADLFREGFSHTLQTWGEENKIPACGYFPRRGPRSEPVYETGPRMPLFALQTYPTVSIGGSVGRADILELKQAVSAQRQLETRGLIGVYERSEPGTTISDLHDDALHDIALGVTYRTIDGVYNLIRQDESFAPHITPGDTAWPWMHTHCDRLARLTWIQSLGRPRCEVLLLLPESSMQAVSRSNNRWRSLSQHLRAIADGMLEHQVDFDFGNETLLRLHGRAEHNRIVMKNTVYSVVVMPPMINMQTQTYALLQDFTMSGGRLLCVGTVPHLLDGEPSPKLESFFEHYAYRITNGVDLHDYEPVFNALKEWNAPIIRFPKHFDASHFIATRRELEGLHFFHITKTGGAARDIRIEFTVETEGHVEFWNHIDGSMTPVCPCSPEEPVVINGPWHFTEARTYVVLPEPMPEDFQPDLPTVIERTLEPEWTATRAHGIPTMLETCRFAGHAWGDVAHTQENLRERLATNPGGVIGHLQWLLPDHAFVDSLDHELVLIAPENVTIELNHAPLEKIKTPAITLPGYTGFTLPAEPGTLQIIGKFRHPEFLAAPIIIPKAPRDPETGDPNLIPVELTPWAEQGLDRFAHTVTYHTEIQGYERFDDAPILLDCEGLHSPAEFRVNGKIIGHRLWPSDRINLRPYWTSGPLILEIIVAGTWANVLHPDNTLRHQGLDTPPRILIHATA